MLWVMETRAKKQKGLPGPPALEQTSNQDIDESNLEIEYMVACSQLGYTDPDVLDYVKKELLNERQPFREAWLM